MNLYAQPERPGHQGTRGRSSARGQRGQRDADAQPAAARQRHNPAVVKLSWKGLAAGSYIGRVTFAGASEPTFVCVLVTPSGAVVVPPTSEDQDSNDGPGDSGDDGKKDKKDKKDKGKKVKKEQGKIQNRSWTARTTPSRRST